MNKHENCVGCKYNTPNSQGGQGLVCNGFTQPIRCPEWAINEYHHLHHLKRGEYFTMAGVREYLKVEK